MGDFWIMILATLVISHIAWQPQGNNSIHIDYGKKLLKLLADTDQHLAAIKEALGQGCELLPQWPRCVEQLAELENARLVTIGNKFASMSIVSKRLSGELPAKHNSIMRPGDFVAIDYGSAVGRSRTSSTSAVSDRAGRFWTSSHGRASTTERS
jgi:hypothetical protein